MRDESKIILTVYDGPHAEHITKIMSIEPTVVHYKGEKVLIGPSNKPAEIISKHDEWKYDSTSVVGSEKPIDDHLEHIRTVLEKQSAEIKNLAKKARIELAIVIYAYNTNPGISISNETLTACANAGVYIDIDLYCISAD